MDWKIVLQILLLFFLGIAAYMDVKSRQISVIYIAAGFAAGILLQILCRSMQVYEVAGGCLLGGLVLLTAFLTRQSVGYGDGLMLAATGIYLGVLDNVVLLLLSLFLSACFGLGMIFMKKKSRKYRLPFLPFLLSGYILILLGS